VKAARRKCSHKELPATDVAARHIQRGAAATRKRHAAHRFPRYALPVRACPISAHDVENGMRSRKAARSVGAPAPGRYPRIAGRRGLPKDAQRRRSPAQ